MNPPPLDRGYHRTVLPNEPRLAEAAHHSQAILSLGELVSIGVLRP